MPGVVVYVQGQGAASASNLNAFIQGTALATDLLASPGISGMNCWVTGTSAVADGGQGFYTWNPTATGPTNLPTVVQPNGVVTGAWVLVPTAIGQLTGPSSPSATAGSGSLPASPAGFIIAYLGGTEIKIPYYNP